MKLNKQIDWERLKKLKAAWGKLNAELNQKIMRGEPVDPKLVKKADLMGDLLIDMAPGWETAEPPGVE